MLDEKENRAAGAENLTSGTKSLEQVNAELAKHEQNRPSGNMSTALVSVSEIEEKEPSWLVSGFIPRGGLSVLAGTGGDGKTSVWCALAAAISKGETTFLERAAGIPFAGKGRKPEKVLCFSSEDSFEHVLRRRLRVNGADLDNVLTIPVSDARFREVRFDSDFLRSLIEANRPSLVIFDPVQGFVPGNIQMSSRNAMRACLEPLLEYGELFGTTFIIVVHSNKRGAAWGRDRMADSADIWDIARSVLMLGLTDEDGVRYLSQEKCNYSELSPTVLFSIGSDNVVALHGTTDKRDRDFVEEKLRRRDEQRAAPARGEARNFILSRLEASEVGALEVKELDRAAKDRNISLRTLSRAKSELEAEGLVEFQSTSGGKNRGVKRVIRKKSKDFPADGEPAEAAANDDEGEDPAFDW